MDRSSLLNDAERRLWDAFPHGTEVDLGEGDPTEEDFDPDAWGEERVVRAEVIARLLLGIRPAEPGYTAKVVLNGAHIKGELLLNASDLQSELLVERCWFDTPPDIMDAATKSIEFWSSRLPGIYASGWHAQGNATFDGCVIEGRVGLRGAKIEGTLSFADTTHTNVGKTALDAPNLVVGGDMVYSNGSTVGEIFMPGAHIQGQLSFDGSTIDNPEADAIMADRVIIDQNLSFQDGFTANGSIKLRAARVHGQLLFTGARLTNPGGDAISADGVAVEQDMYFDEGFIAQGQLRIVGSFVGGVLSFIGANLSNPGGVALSADDVVVNQNMFCREGFTAEGEISLSGAKVHGLLSFRGATLSNPDARALSANAAIIDENMLCDEGFAAKGRVSLSGAHIKGELLLDGASLEDPDGVALGGINLIVDRDMSCQGLVANGQVRLFGAKIQGQLSFEGATLADSSGLALDLEGLAAGTVRLGTSTLGGIDLTQARVGVLAIPSLKAQPRMKLSGLVYADLDPDPDPPIRHRIAWLRKDPDAFHPQPYEQLALYYRGIGHDREARLVLLAKRRTRRRTAPRAWKVPTPLRQILATAWRIPGWVSDALAGYGYVPLRAFCWLVLAIFAGAMGLSEASLPTPTGNDFLNAVLFALDTIVPTSPFGLRAQTTLTGSAFGIAMALQILGYALALAVLPAVSRALSRGDK